MPKSSAENETAAYAVTANMRYVAHHWLRAFKLKFSKLLDDSDSDIDYASTLAHLRLPAALTTTFQKIRAIMRDQQTELPEFSN